jgi:hypothetical protein
MEEMRNVYTVLVDTFERKGAPGRLKSKGRDNRTI